MKSHHYIKSLEEQNEALQKKLSLLEGQVAGYLKDRDKLLVRYNEAVRQGELKHMDYENACKQIAEMHAAAVGEIVGPRRGITEDIADLRENYLLLLGKQKKQTKKRKNI